MNRLQSSVDNEQASDTPIDAVFVIGNGSRNNNEELRYALRDLAAFCQWIRDVYIVGVCPDWVDKTKVKWLDHQDQFRHQKDANIIDKLLFACRQPGISDRILFCSDDQFVTRPAKWEDFEPQWLRRYDPKSNWYSERGRANGWFIQLRDTLEKERRRRLELKDPEAWNPDGIYYYQPHMWMQILRDKFIEYAEWSDYKHTRSTIIASGYMNFVNAGGRSLHDHIFIPNTVSWPIDEMIVAYTDNRFNGAMRFLKPTFPSPSKYEIGYDPTVPVYDDKLISRRDTAQVSTSRAWSDSGQPANPVHPVSPVGPASPVSPVSPVSPISPASPTSPTSPVSPVRDDEDDVEAAVLSDFLAKLAGEPAWAPLMAEGITAEKLRILNLAGWKHVWNNIMDRWNTDTSGGLLRVPVITPADERSNIIVSGYADKIDGVEYRAPEPATPPQALPVPEPKPAPAPRKKRCPSCEAKRRRAEERRRREAAEKARRAASVEESLPVPPAMTMAESRFDVVQSMRATSDVGCIDCAIEHLAKAVAYLRSNRGVPEFLDVELARGEISLAADQIALLGKPALSLRIASLVEADPAPTFADAYECLFKVVEERGE